ncbi:MAG: ribokinase [Chloroflexota bacterium]|nr:MAG: ribokinase [Chloroflexota bacterium]
MSSPDFVIVGHVTIDVVADGMIPGGTATFAGRMAANLGARVGVVTSAATDYPFSAALPNVTIANRAADKSSTFENLYRDGVRTQYVRAVAEPLDASAIPADWTQASIALLAPLTNEVLPSVESAFPGALKAATPQGWLRHWGDDGLVRLWGWDTLVERLRGLDAVILSEEDVLRDESTIAMLRQEVRLLVVTRGSAGSTLFENGRAREFAPFPAREIDPTGAGDAFAAAFLVRLAETGDSGAACEFANCAASFVVEAVGATGVPTRAQVEARLRSHQ